MAIGSIVGCQEIYPVENIDKNCFDLKTIGAKLNKGTSGTSCKGTMGSDPGMGRNGYTGYRFDRRQSDETFRLKITSYRPEKS